MAVDPITQGITPYMQGAMVDAIANYVYETYRTAIAARAPITKRMVQAIYANNLTYAPGLCPEGDVDVYQGIIASKATVVEAWLKSVLLSAVNQLWDVRPTEKPELPDELNKAIFAMLLEYVQNTPNFSPDMLENAQGALNELAAKHVKTVASEKVNTMKAYIADMLDDADFATQLATAIVDLTHTTHMVMCGPEVVAEDAITFDEAGNVITKRRMTLRFRRVDPLSFYWTPDCQTPQTGSALFEESLVPVNELLDAVEAAIPGYIPEGVSRATDPARRYNMQLTPHDVLMEGVRADTAATMPPEGMKRVVRMRGYVPGRVLKPYDASVDERRMHECEVWVVDGVTVRLLIGVNKMVNRNYYTASMYEKGGTMVGNGLCDMLRTTERMANAALRASAKNMPFSAEPITEVDVNRFVDPADVRDFKLIPGKTYKVESDPLGGGARAIIMTDIPVNVDKFVGLYTTFMEGADRISGIPAYINGNIDVAAMARTASGLSILMQSASVVLQNVVMHIDKRLFTPMIRNCYNWLMLYHPDPSIKADAKVMATGASGVLNRELSQAKLMDLLQLLAPYAQAQMVPPSSLLAILRQVIANTGYDVDSIIPADADSQLLSFVNALTRAQTLPDSTPSLAVAPPTAGPGTNPGTPALR